MVLSDEIDSIQKELNQPENIPRMGFRRNSGVYELVCYVNNITACYLSKNYSDIRVFASRCRTYMDLNKKSDHQDYYERVKKYLDCIESYIEIKGVRLD